MPEREFDAAVGDDNGHSWVQCDACNKWRAITESTLAQIQAGGDTWDCSQLFKGATCSLKDDWQLHVRDEKLPISERKRKEIVEERTAAQQVKLAHDTKRAKRAAERAQGVSAAERHVPGETVQLDNGQEVTEEQIGRKKPGRRGRPPKARDHGTSAEHCQPDEIGAEERTALSLSHWEVCMQCNTWVELGPGSPECEGKACPSCGEQVNRKQYKELECWVQCDACGKWRSIAQCLLKEVEASPSWTCTQLRSGATCKSSASDWGSVVRRAAAAQRLEERAKSAIEDLSARFVQLPGQHVPRHHPPNQTEPPDHMQPNLDLPQAQPDQAAPDQANVAQQPQTCKEQLQHWALYPVPVSSQLLEYIPGRDTLFSAPDLAAGLDALDSGSAEHVLWATALPRDAFDCARPFVLRAIQLYREGRLPECTDGRLSNGPVDIAAFLAQPHIKEAIQQALHRRKKRLSSMDGLEPSPDQAGIRHAAASECNALMLSHVVHVSPDSRKIYIGEECDVTCKGGSIMGFCKSWRSLPIRSWSGGIKMADMPGTQPPRAVQSTLSALLAPEEPGLVAAAEALWDMFAAHPATADAAARMAQRSSACPVHAAAALGRTAWNAYSFNLDYRTGKHLDGKNMPGSYSALVVLETGVVPFAGGFYMLPQYHKALDLRQGLVLFHRSGDKTVGLHGNSGLWLPQQDSHRIALVFYQTQLKNITPVSKGFGSDAEGADITAKEVKLEAVESFHEVPGALKVALPKERVPE
ncbi:g10721 [Coccomyxa elongata]